MTKQKGTAVGGWFDIRKKLSKVTERDLLALVGELYQLSPKNRSFLESRFLPNETTLEKYKAAIDGGGKRAGSLSVFVSCVRGHAYAQDQRRAETVTAVECRPGQ